MAETPTTRGYQRIPGGKLAVKMVKTLIQGIFMGKLAVKKMAETPITKGYRMGKLAVKKWLKSLSQGITRGSK